MDANPEVMQPVATSLTRPAPADHRSSKAVDVAERTEAPRSRGGDGRLSEDPMRRTDRYRLVMPYSNRV
jgi:hypothetical protein